MFDYDNTVNLAFDAKIAGKKLVTAKHELLTKTGDFLFLAHSDKELAQRMQMVEEDIEKVAYRKLANVSDSKAKLVRAIYDEWSIRHANCDFCKEAKNVSNDGGGKGKAPAMQSMMQAVPGAKDPGIVKDVSSVAKGVAHAVGTGVGAFVRNEIAKGPIIADDVKAIGNEVTKAPGQIADAVRSYGNAENNVIKSVGTGIADAAKGAISGAGSLISQFTQGFKGTSTPAPAAADKASGFSSAADVAAHQRGQSGNQSTVVPITTSPGAASMMQQMQKKPSVVTTTTSSDSDNDGDVDMGRAASKIANLSELLKGSNDTNFIS